LQNPKDRWQWAFTRIIQVGGEWQAWHVLVGFC
jgi:hypothetical protein